VKHLDEYRDPDDVRRLAALIKRETTRPWTIMEICGGQTHTIMREGLEELLPPLVSIVHGPGCPVCVTPVALIDRAIAIAATPGVTLASFGDMMRVPGSTIDLLTAKARGGDVRMVYSPLDALALARRHAERRVVFFAVGFETTAPACAMAVREAARTGVTNFSILSAHVLVPPAVRAILSAPGNLVQAFLAAGHVCVITGVEEYLPLADEFRVPIVVTGFEPVDIMQGILLAVRQLERARHVVENQYARAVLPAGNLPARALLEEVFEISDRAWRGLGVLNSSGYRLRAAYRAFDAEWIFPADGPGVPEVTECIAGLVLQGREKPLACPAFGTRCTPGHPLGAPMVSSEGACAAYYSYSTRRLTTSPTENIA
jgi:hydrogenase expression/formation protein HypD